MYNVTVNGQTTEVTSYANAGKVLRESLNNAAQVLINTNISTLRRIYRSPKTAAREMNSRVQRAETIKTTSPKLGKTAGNYDGRIAGVNWSIVKAA